MSLTERRGTSVTATGVGRKDYSQNIEYSVEKELRSLQERFFYSYQFTGLTALVFPNIYESLLQFLINGALQYEAPHTNPWMFYLAGVSTKTNNYCVVTLNRYLSYTDYLAGTVVERLGTAVGFVNTKLEFTKGIPTVPNSLYSVQYGVFSGVDFDLDLVVHGLVGGQEDL